MVDCGCPPFSGYPKAVVRVGKPTLERLLEIGPVFCNRCAPEELKGRQYRSGWIDTFCSTCQAVTPHSAYGVLPDAR